jgi:hypothetical protein
MIDIETETLLTFSQAAAEQPCRRQGKRVSTVTLWRWATRGSGGVILETLQTPSGRVTSREAVARFFLAHRATPGRVRRCASAALPPAVNAIVSGPSNSSTGGNHDARSSVFTIPGAGRVILPAPVSSE